MTNQTERVLAKQLDKLEDRFLDGKITPAEYKKQRIELKETFKGE